MCVCVRVLCVCVLCVCVCVCANVHTCVTVHSLGWVGNITTVAEVSQ